MKSLIIIPARGGSTRVPNKNLALLNGKPLIYYSIKAASLLDDVDIIVSTDSSEIANYSESLGVKVPFLRPSNLSTAKSTSISVIVHILYELIKNNCDLPEIIIFKPPTNPFLTPLSIRNMIDLKKENRDIDSIMSIQIPRVSALSFLSYCEIDRRIETQIYDIDGCKLYDIERSQDRPLSYASSPACKITESNYFLERYINRKIIPEDSSGPTFNFQNSSGYIINNFEAYDIDTLEDLAIAKLIIQSNEKVLDKKIFNHIYN